MCAFVDCICWVFCRQLRKLREEGKLPKGGLEAGKIHGLTKEDLKGPSLDVFKPSEKDAERVEYVLDSILCVTCCHACHTGA